MDAENAHGVLTDVFGHAEFRGRQAEVIEALLRGQHVLMIMPTGGGKSLCYQIPALLAPKVVPGDARPTLTVVLSPLIALMKDQVDSLQTIGVEATFVNSSLSRQQRQQRYQELADGRHRLLYVTPERFRKEDFRQVIAGRNVVLMAVDEAHCISQWGHDFRPDYSRVREWRQLLGDPTTIALTATATPEVQMDIVRQLGLASDQMHLVHEGINRPNLQLNVEPTWSDDIKSERIRQRCEAANESQQSGIVYFTLIKSLERFSDRLHSDGIRHACYHGALERLERSRIQNQFMQGAVPVVLATNAFGMGIDKDNIRFVMHAEVPGSLESYYQEVGRAGRDGRPSDCTLLYDERDLMTQMEFIEWKNPDAEFFDRVYDLLKHDSERIEAFGFEWLNNQLQCRSRHDHRLDTVLALLDRYDVVAGSRPPDCFRLVGPVPRSLVDPERLAEKRRRDQLKLYGLVQFAKHDGDRKQFLNEYFGLGVCPDM